MDSQRLVHVVQKMSRAGRPKKPVHIKGRLHESAIGAIYFASMADSGDSMVVKTLDLNKQNIWSVSKNNSRTTLRGLNDAHVLFLCEERDEACEWASLWCDPFEDRADVTVGKVAYLTTYDDKMKPVKIRLNEFLNEATVGLIVSQTVGLKVPHIVMTRDAWIDDAHGHILQDYGGISLFKNMADLTLQEFKSIVMQMLVTIALGQEACQLKHHDVHLDNVFLNRLKPSDSFNGQVLSSKPKWSYSLQGSKGPVHISIEHCGILAKLGDFGLSSASLDGVRFERVDYPLLDAAEKEWGEWSGTLEGQKTYDVAVFLSKFFMDDERSKCPSKLSSWARDCYADIRKAVPILECSVIGRPIRGREGNMSCADILTLPIFAEFAASEEGLKLC